jgi:hypothetical protein
MATRKAAPKARPTPTGLVPALRTAVKVVERALAELGATPSGPRKRAARPKPTKR